MRAYLGLALGLVAGLFLPVGSWAFPVGNPAGVIGQGRYHVAIETVRSPREVQGDDYVASGFLLKLQGGLLPGLDLYARLGRQGITIPAAALSTQLEGDTRLSYGGGVKIALPEIPGLALASYLDLGTQGFHSSGTLTVTQPADPTPFLIDLENSYAWREYRAAWGIRQDRKIFSPYAGISASWVDMDVTRRQLGSASPPTQVGHVLDGPTYAAFLGLDLRLTQVIHLTVEMNQDGSSGAGYTLAISEISR